MRLPVYAMTRRRLLPECEITLHLGRPLSFRRFEDAYGAGRELFIATVEGAHLRPIGVVAKIVSLSRIPSPRRGGEPEDRAVLRGARRAAIPAATPADAAEAEIARLDENEPRSLDETTREALALLAETVRTARRAQLSASGREAAAVDATKNPIARIYRLATFEQAASWTRTLLLETDDLRRKADVLSEALREEIDLAAIETRLLARL